MARAARSTTHKKRTTPGNTENVCFASSRSRCCGACQLRLRLRWFAFGVVLLRLACSAGAHQSRSIAMSARRATRATRATPSTVVPRRTMFIQTGLRCVRCVLWPFRSSNHAHKHKEETPNPDSLKFVPGEEVLVRRCYVCLCVRTFICTKKETSRKKIQTTRPAWSLL